MGHPGWVLTPLVLGPDLVPFVTDPDEAERVPEPAVLSAVAHGGDPGGGEVLTALVSAFAVVDTERVAVTALDLDDYVFQNEILGRRHRWLDPARTAWLRRAATAETIDDVFV